MSRKAEALAGLTELGARKLAAREAKELLLSASPSPEEFREALRAAAVNDYRKIGTRYVFNSGKWRPLVERSYSQLRSDVRRLLRPAMMLFYFNCGDSSTAAQYLDEEYSRAEDLATALRVARLNNRDERFRYASNAELLLKHADGFARDDLHDALVDHYLAERDLKKAAEHSDAILLLDVFSENAILRRIEIAIRGVLHVLQLRMRLVDQYGSLPATDMDLALSKFRAERLKTATVRLNRMRHRLLGTFDLCPCGSGKKFKNCCGRVA